MTIFDLTCGLVLAVSILVGLANGAVREIVGLFAFGLAAALAALLLPFTGPLAAAALHAAPVVAKAAAVVTTFVVAYIGLKLSAHWLTMRLRDRAALGAIDRVGGAGVGLVRALVLMGLFAIVYGATPSFLRQPWIDNAKLYPVARAAGHAMAAFAPRGLGAAGHLGGSLKDSLSSPTDSGAAADSGPTLDQTPPAKTAPAPPPHRRRHGYSPESRRNLDVLVERSR